MRHRMVLVVAIALGVAVIVAPVATAVAYWHLRSLLATCLASSPACDETQREALPLCRIGFPGACDALDAAFHVQFVEEERASRARNEARQRREPEQEEPEPPTISYIYFEHARLSDMRSLHFRNGSQGIRIETGNGQDPTSILKGTSLVLSIRSFSEGRRNVIDDESFETLSIELGPAAIGRTIDLSSVPRLYYAAGSVVWSPPAGSRFATRAKGSVTVVRSDQKRGILRVRIDLTLQPLATSGTDSPPEKKISGEYSFVRESLEQRPVSLGGNHVDSRPFLGRDLGF